MFSRVGSFSVTKSRRWIKLMLAIPQVQIMWSNIWCLPSRKEGVNHIAEEAIGVIIICWGKKILSPCEWELVWNKIRKEFIQIPCISKKRMGKEFFVMTSKVMEIKWVHKSFNINFCEIGKINEVILAYRETWKCKLQLCKKEMKCHTLSCQRK